MWRLFAAEYPDVEVSQAFAGDIYKVEMRYPLVGENTEAKTQQIFVCEYPEKSLNDALQLVVRDDGGLQIREPGAIPVRAVELDPNQYLVYDAPVYQDDSWRASIYNPY